ncbi:hypothetical protein F511_07229 [Dorcoceras hygrometricum]|uniref:Uncharacterized protein n=1 Tax=Dorcoceras hygrometricum TaxID=472368 RepID=A0A2Z7B1G0_9LAMI|nr:hypothetical protein F511_07229 [Dorcoceras hygrometricum]
MVFRILRLVVRCSLRLLVPAFVFLNQRLVFQLREIVRYCSLQLVVVTVASDWMAYAMRRRFGLAWFGISAASFFASAGRDREEAELIPVRVVVRAGNPGSTAGRGFNPAGGAPGGG